MPDETFIDSNDPDSGVYEALIEKSKRSDAPKTEVTGNKAEELTIADSIPPESSNNEVQESLKSLRPAPVPTIMGFPAVNPEARSDANEDHAIEVGNSDLNPDELAVIEGLGPFNDKVTEGLEDEPTPPSTPIVVSEERMSWPPKPGLGHAAQQALEEFEHEEIIAELLKQLGIHLQQAEFLPVATLRNIKTLLLEHTWIADTEILQEAIMIIMTSLDPNFGVKIRSKANNLGVLIEMFLERLELRDLHQTAIKLRKNLPKAGSVPPPPLPNP